MKTKNYHFIIVWLGQLISNIGSGIAGFALGIYIFHVTHSASYYSLLLLSAFLPALLLKPIGGTLADRMNRKLIMILGDGGAALGMMVIFIALYLGYKQLWIIYMGTIISSIFMGLQNPAYKASITDLVSAENYAKASGLMQLAESSKYVIAPIIAGYLINHYNIKTLVFIDAVSFIAAMMTTLFINSKTEHESKGTAQKHFWVDLKEGFHYLLDKKEILKLISIISLVTYFVGLLQSLWGPMILPTTSSQLFGISQTVAISGLLLGSSLISFFGRSSNEIDNISKGLRLCGVFFALMGISSNLIVVTLCGFLFFLMLPLVNTNLDVLIRSSVSNEMQGRVWALVSLISQVGMVLALAMGGFLADHMFNPLLTSHGPLANTIGVIMGTGPSRGIGIIFFIAGICVFSTAYLMKRYAMEKMGMVEFEIQSG